MGSNALSDTRRALLTAVACVPLSLVRSAAITTALVLSLWSLTAGGEVGSDVSTASRLVVVVWLSSFGARVTALGGSWSLMPLGLVAVTAWSCHRAARRGLRDLGYPARPATLTFLAVFAVGHVAVISGLSWWVSHEGVRFAPGQAALASGVGVVVICLAVAMSDRRAAVINMTLPDTVVVALAVARRTLLSLLLVSSLALAISSIVHWRESTTLTQQFGAGLSVTVGMWLVSALLAPNVAVWGAGFLVGAPVAVHATQTISVFAGVAEKLPPLPILAVFPQQPPNWAWILLLVPLVLFAGFAYMGASSQVSTSGKSDGLGAVLATSILTAMAVALLAGAGSFIASGSLGYSGWPRLGLDWQTPAYAAAVTFVGSAFGVWWATRKPVAART